MRYLALLVLVVLMSGAMAVAADKPASKPVGVNLEGLSDYMGVEMLMDLTKTARRFGKVDKPYENGEDAVKRDADGWPLEDAGLVLRADRPSPARSYTYSFKGRARVTFFPGDQVKTDEPTYDPNTQITSGSFKTLNGLGTLFMSFHDTDGGIRDLKVMRDQPAVGSFTKAFIDKMSLFRGKTLRFMDLQATNGSEQSTWDKRSRPQDWNYRGTLPPELLAELTNTLEADGWYCMPHQADDDYIRQFAEVIRDATPDGRTIYVEHSNEVWNDQFKQAHYATQQGEKAGLGGGYGAQLAYHGVRTAHIGRIWKEVFANRPNVKIVAVLGAQAANPFTAEKSLEPEGVAADIDAVAIAPYMGTAFPMEDPEPVLKLSVDQLLDAVQKQLEPGGEVAKYMSSYAQFCKEHGKPLLAYEGGQHLVGRGGSENSEALTALLIAANRSPRMGELYKQYLDLWFANSDDVMCLFSFSGANSKWGSWGLIENLDQPESQTPKFKAVKEYLGQ